MVLAFFKCGVVLDLLFDALLHIDGGQLQHLHQLDLLRTQLLLEFQVKALLQHAGVKLRALHAAPPEQATPG